eukprot:6280158-Amphidinium_carterae.2
MKVNLKKTVVLCNGAKTKKLMQKVWRTGRLPPRTDGSGRHSADPHHRRCGVGYYTDTQEHVWLPLPGRLKVVSDCKGVVKAVQALQQGRRTPKGRSRDLELRALHALLPG